MTEQEQIGFMAKHIINDDSCGDCLNCKFKDICGDLNAAKRLYRAGCRVEEENWRKSIDCPQCGAVMHYIGNYKYSNQPTKRVEGIIYHCEDCGHDECIESTWERTGVSQRTYFHG